MKGVAEITTSLLDTHGVDATERFSHVSKEIIPRREGSTSTQPLEIPQRATNITGPIAQFVEMPVSA